MAQTLHFCGNEQHPWGSPVLRRYVMGAGPDPYHPRDPDKRDAEVDIVQGPVESGKSAGSFAKLYKLICTMPRSKDGIRRSRWLVHRQTYPEITDTVLPDFLEWFPPEIYGTVRGSEPIVYQMRFLDVEADIVFMAIPDDSEKTMKKLRSSFFTGAYGNEGQFNTLKMVTSVIDRTGRYPRKMDCPAYDRKKRYFMDMNAPERFDHWVLMMRGDTPISPDMPADQAMAYSKPSDWDFYVQPGAVFEKLDINGEIAGYELNEHAENLQNMGAKPYLPAIPGKPRDQIDRDFRNITRASKGGAARYPDFSQDIHVAKQELVAFEGAEIQIGVDPGGSPGYTIGQKVDARWYVLHAEEMHNTDADELARRIISVLNERFGFFREVGVSVTGDPAGTFGQLNTRTTTRQIFAANGLPYDVPAAKDKPDLRMTTGRSVMRSLVRGAPKLMICPVHCRQLIQALDGGMQMADGKLIKKSTFANVGESFEYLLWGGGEANEVIQRPEGTRRAPISTITGRGSPYRHTRKWKNVSRSGMH